jgi:hypothetical protein
MDSASPHSQGSVRTQTDATTSPANTFLLGTALAAFGNDGPSATSGRPLPQHPLAPGYGRP